MKKVHNSIGKKILTLKKENLEKFQKTQKNLELFIIIIK